jgi:hypothetical protein
MKKLKKKSLGLEMAIEKIRKVKLPHPYVTYNEAELAKKLDEIIEVVNELIPKPPKEWTEEEIRNAEREIYAAMDRYKSRLKNNA